MSTISEFLLARIAEDEAMARRGFSHPDRWVVVAVPGLPDGAPNGISCTAVLAECQAKRVIVEDFAAHSDGGFPDGQWDEHERVLSALAAVYADHPDYRQEWAL